MTRHVSVKGEVWWWCDTSISLGHIRNYSETRGLVKRKSEDHTSSWETIQIEDA